MIKHIDVTGIMGNPIRVIRVPKGVQCPNHKNNTANDTLIEFYDLRYIEDFTPDGQFISAYYTSTLTLGASNAGLNLEGNEPSWSITARTYNLIKEWLVSFTR